MSVCRWKRMQCIQRILIWEHKSAIIKEGKDHGAGRVLAAGGNSFLIATLFPFFKYQTRLSAGSEDQGDKDLKKKGKKVAFWENEV